jgi:succinate dehydrogenase/fumarate reductase iron-sulfur protein
MKITIKRTGGNESFDFRASLPDVRVVALDALLQAADTAMPDLAYRYGCRNGLCGVCTVNINGRPRLACRTRIKEGDEIAPMTGLPLLQDLIVRRDQVNRQLTGRLPMVAVEGPLPDKRQLDTVHSLNRCIECYACLHKCASHAKNPVAGPYRYGNPYSFLRIQKICVSPYASGAQKQQALALARELSIDDYDANQVPACGVGINLKTEVIQPLQAMSKSS